MRRSTPLLFLSLVGSALLGCGGGSTRSRNNDNDDFDGRYSGTYVAQSGNGPSGTLQVVVDDGEIRGTGTDTRYSGTGTVDTSSIIRNGSVSLILVYGSSNVILRGRVDQDDNDVITGIVQEQQGATAAVYNVTLTPVED